uniref:hypothetical protein n=1 Tax=Trinickia mobilis TaxID=2816356 RepID=UPI001A900AEC
MKRNNSPTDHGHRFDAASSRAMPRGRQYGRLRMRNLSVTLAVVLSGCAVGPDYVAPTTQFAPFHNTIT